MVSHQTVKNPTNIICKGENIFNIFKFFFSEVSSVSFPNLDVFFPPEPVLT